jgi:FtsP/CotA-like multicopper oxidase with cupredoxin domain
VTLKNGKPVGGVKTIRVEKGKFVRLKVVSNRVDEVHVHGYDVEKRVGPGRNAIFVFRATFEGIFEVELHSNGTVIAKLVVNP